MRGRSSGVGVAVVLLLTSSCAYIARVSVDSAGAPSAGNSSDPEISADGRYVAFTSQAANLVAGDTNLVNDIFVHDALTGTTTRVSVDSAGVQGNRASFAPTISGDGRYVAFSSDASNLSGVTGWDERVHVHDTQTGTTSLVSVNDTIPGDDGGDQPAISADGRYVAFRSSSKLVPGDRGGVDIYLRDLVAGVTTQVSVDSAGNEGNDASWNPSISADGRYVAFESKATNLVAGDTDGNRDIFVRDTVAGTTSRVSLDHTGAEVTFWTFWNPSISGDGRYVAFQTMAPAIVPGDTNGVFDVFVRDTVADTTSRVSVDSNGVGGNGQSQRPSVSHDGRYIAFHSYADNLVAADTNRGVGWPHDGWDVFVRDTVAGSTTRVSVAADGTQSSIDSYWASISADGNYVAFNSGSTNLVPGTPGFLFDIFLKRARQPTISAVTPAAAGPGDALVVTIDGSGYSSATDVRVGNADVTIDALTLVSETQLELQLTVDPAAAVGTSHSVIVYEHGSFGHGTGAAAQCSGCFTVTAPH